ncbi:Spc97/Spc98-like spindle pole body protein, partial [Pseudoloma neurophilia]
NIFYTLDDICDILDHSPFINVLDPKLDNSIHNRLKLIDSFVKEVFLKGCHIAEHLKFCKESFFFGRNDFIEHLFFYMKEISKSNFGKRSYSFILDTAIQTSFGKNNPFSQYLDMCVLKDDDFSIFYKLSFPINIIIEKDIILIFLSIFKYLWKVKRVEHFLRRLKELKNIDQKNIIIINKWYILIQKLFFYFSYEVIEIEFINLLKILENETFVIDKLRHGLKRLLKNVIKGIFQENNQGKETMEIFLNSLEQECHNFRKHKTIFNDEHIRTNCLNLMNTLQINMENTSLFNITAFI